MAITKSTEVVFNQTTFVVMGVITIGIGAFFGWTVHDIYNTDSRIRASLGCADLKAPGLEENIYLKKLTYLYMLTHDGIRPEMIAGLEYPDDDWLNVELVKLGLSWRVHSYWEGNNYSMGWDGTIYTYRVLQIWQASCGS